MHGTGRDFSYAWRTWRRTPGSLAAAVGALALGLGAATAVFSIVGGVLLAPLPYAHPDRLVMVWQDMRTRGGPEREWASPGLFVEWQRRATVFEHLAAVRGWTPNLTGGGEPERLRGAAVSHEYFDALGVPPAFGRTFSAEDDRPGGAPLVVLSHALWTRRFGADPTLVGRAITLDGQAATVGGVMPASFQPAIVDAAEIFAPIGIDPAQAPRGMIVLRVLGTLAPGVALGEAQASMAALAQVLERDDPEWERARVQLVPLLDDMVGNVRVVLLVLAAAVAIVLLVACANVGSLLLARASDRSRELTVRVALGAGRWQIVRQLLVESAFLAAAASVLGLLLAAWAIRGAIAIAPASVPRLDRITFDSAAAVVGLTASVLAALATGLVPAAAAWRLDLSSALRGGGCEATGARAWRSLLVAAEVALAVTLVISAALLTRSLAALQRVDLGFRHERLLTASVAPPRGTYRGDEALRGLYGRLLERSAALPGVTSAALTSTLPLSGTDSDFTFAIEGRPPARSPADEPHAWFRVVSPGLFQTMGMRMVQGRGLTADDRTDAPAVAVVTEALAKRYWPDASPIGARIRVERQEATIVGVVADVRHRGPSSAAQAEMYLSYLQFSARAAWLVLRTDGAPSGVTPSLRAAVRDVDPLLPLAAIAPMDDLVARSLSQPRFISQVLGAFSVVAGCLALVGVYSVVSYSVSRRARELGVRMALGAGRGAVVRHVMWGSLALVAGGIAAGVAGAVLASRLLRTLLFGVGPGDPATFAAMAVMTLAAGAVAAYGPARRASRIDPLTALRED
jgi:putative ABC transport system permease protein